jgi:DNA topoisomerase III
MSYKLILTEKPSVARELAAALGGFSVVEKSDPTNEGKKRPIYLTNSKSNIHIIWAFGHLVQYDAKRPTTFSELPVIPKENEWNVKPISPSHEFQLMNISKLVNSDDVDNIINCCDAEREGELIFNLIIDACKIDRKSKKFDRMWIQSMGKDALVKSYKDRKPASEYAGLDQASRSRAKADWMVGINASNAFSIISERIWQTTQAASIGRVKTSALAMVYSRCKEIEDFIPTKYWEVKGSFNVKGEVYEGRWIDMTKYNIPDKAQNAENPDSADKGGKDNSGKRIEDCSRIATQEQLNEIMQRVAIDGTQLKPTTAYKDIITRKENNSPPLFSLVQAQVVGQKKFKYTVQKVLDIIQKLYEKKAVTYPRTDSSHLPQDYPEEAKAVLLALSKSPNESLNIYAEAAISGVSTVGSRVFNQAKVSDHFAIIPTVDVPNMSELSQEERNIYEMIVNRFKAVFMPPCISNVTTRFTFVTEQDAFRTTGTVIVQKGWTELEDKESKKAVLPLVSELADIESTTVVTEEKKTHPKKMYTDADLVLAMENGGRDLEDELADALDGKGIGTSSTRSQIIEELLATVTAKGKPKQPMMVREKSFLIPTDYGRKIIETLLAEDIYELVSAKFTGEWELSLNQVRENPKNAKAFMEKTENTVISIIAKLKTLAAKYPEPEFDVKCRKCGGDMEVGRYRVVCKNINPTDPNQKPCDFKVPRSISGKNFTLEEIRSLILLGKTTEMHDFISSKNSTFKAGLQFNDVEELAWFYPPDTIREEPCPLCNSEMVDRPKVIRCTNDQCNLAVFKNYSKKDISEKYLHQLLTEKKTDMIKGFYSEKKQKNFDAYFVINEETKSVDFGKQNQNGVETEYTCLKNGCEGIYFEKAAVFECNLCKAVIFKKTNFTDIPQTKLKKLLKGEEISMTGKRRTVVDGVEKLIPQAVNIRVDRQQGKLKSEFVNPTKKS